jgi:hypothetical protein
VDRGDPATALQLAGGDFILCCASMATERRPSPARPHETSRRSPLEGLPIGSTVAAGSHGDVKAGFSFPY